MLTWLERTTAKGEDDYVVHRGFSLLEINEAYSGSYMEINSKHRRGIVDRVQIHDCKDWRETGP